MFYESLKSWPCFTFKLTYIGVFNNSGPKETFKGKQDDLFCSRGKHIMAGPMRNRVQCALVVPSDCSSGMILCANFVFTFRSYFFGTVERFMPSFRYGAQIDMTPSFICSRLPHSSIPLRTRSGKGPQSWQESCVCVI